jgi:hypothetical protein
MTSDGIPIAFDPKKSGARLNRLHGVDARRRRRSDPDADGDLGA